MKLKTLKNPEKNEDININNNDNDIIIKKIDNKNNKITENNNTEQNYEISSEHNLTEKN